MRPSSMKITRCAFPFTFASKITFIDLNLAAKHGFTFSFQFQSDDLA